MDADREIIDASVRTRATTLKLVEAIPDDWFNRKAEGEAHSLGWALQHIASGDTWWMERVMHDGGGVVQPLQGATREQIVAALRAVGDRVVGFFSHKGAMAAMYSYPRPEGGTQELSGRWCLLYLLQHEVHHRGKIVLALRQWGLDRIPFIPYSGW